MEMSEMRGSGLIFKVYYEPRTNCTLHEKVDAWEKSHEEEERQREEELAKELNEKMMI